MIRRVILALVGILMLFGVTIAGTQPAQASVNDAVISSSTVSQQSLRICRNWGETTCSDGVGYLSPGQNSKTKYGWVDADGFYVPGDSVVTSGKTIWYGPRWVKVSGCGGCTKAFSIRFK